MAYPSNINTVICQGYWYDAASKQGVDADITFSPVPLSGSSPTPNLTDLVSYSLVKTRVFTVTPDPTTGYFAVPLIANDDPDLTAFGGWLVKLEGEDPFTITVPYSTGSTSATAQMAAAVSGLTQGQSVQALWLTEAAVITGTPPTPPNSYLTAGQTASAIATAIAGLSGGGGGSYTDEQARDAVGAALVQGSGISITVDDTANTITIAATGGGSYTDEQAQDALAALFAAGTHSGISFVYNDAGNAISATVTAPSASSITTGTLPDGVIPAGITRDSEVATAVANLVNSAPSTLDTLGEIATALQSDESAAAALTTTVSGKLAKASNLSDVVSAATARTNLGAAPGFTQSTTKTATYTAADNEIVPIDTTGGTFTVTGPTSGAPFGYRWKAGTAAPTIAAPSGYTISGNASVTPGLPPSGTSGELVLYQAFGADYQPVGGMKPQSALDARFVKAATGGFSAYVAASTPSGAATGDVWIPTTPVALSDLGGQPLDSDLTTIAGLTATTDSFLQAKSGAWTTRTIAQVRADLAVELGIPSPADYGIIGWSSDPVGGMGGASTITSGTMWVTRVAAAQAGTVGTILAYVNVAGATPTAGQCAAVLYNSTGTQVGITGDVGSQLTSIGMKGLTLTAGVTVNAGDIFYVGVLSTATTQPSWARASLVTTPSALGTVVMPVSRYGQYPTGSLTAPPSSITPGSLTANGTAAFWAAIKA